MFGATFNLVYTCLSTVIFWTLKDRNLEINILASKIVLATESCSKMALALCQKWFWKTRFFVKKLKILCSFDQMILFKFH